MARNHDDAKVRVVLGALRSLVRISDQQGEPFSFSRDEFFGQGFKEAEAGQTKTAVEAIRAAIKRKNLRQSLIERLVYCTVLTQANTDHEVLYTLNMPVVDMVLDDHEVNGGLLELLLFGTHDRIREEMSERLGLDRATAEEPGEQHEGGQEETQEEWVSLDKFTQLFTTFGTNILHALKTFHSQWSATVVVSNARHKELVESVASLRKEVESLRLDMRALNSMTKSRQQTVEMLAVLRDKMRGQSEFLEMLADLVANYSEPLKEVEDAKQQEDLKQQEDPR